MPKIKSTITTTPARRGRPGKDEARAKTVKCPTCGTRNRRALSDLNGHKNHFCNHVCAARHINAARGCGETATYSCAWCDAPIVRYASQVNDPDRVFCNREHFQNWRRAGGHSEKESNGGAK